MTESEALIRAHHVLLAMESGVPSFGRSKDLIAAEIQRAVEEERGLCEQIATKAKKEAREFVNSDVIAGALWAAEEIEQAIRARATEPCGCTPTHECEGHRA